MKHISDTRGYRKIGTITGKQPKVGELEAFIVTLTIPNGAFIAKLWERCRRQNSLPDDAGKEVFYTINRYWQ